MSSNAWHASHGGFGQKYFRHAALSREPRAHLLYKVSTPGNYVSSNEPCQRGSVRACHVLHPSLFHQPALTWQSITKEPDLPRHLYLIPSKRSHSSHLILFNARLGLRIIASLLSSIPTTTLITPAAALIPFPTSSSTLTPVTSPANPFPTATSTVMHKLTPTRSRIQINKVMIVLSRTSKAERDMIRRSGVVVGFDK